MALDEHLTLTIYAGGNAVDLLGVPFRFDGRAVVSARSVLTAPLSQQPDTGVLELADGRLIPVKLNIGDGFRPGTAVAFPAGSLTLDLETPARV